MLTQDIPLETFKLDLRSARGTAIQKGLFIRAMRVVILILLDALCVSLSWVLALSYGTQLQFPWTVNSSLLLLNLCVQISIMMISGLYQAGQNRRNYPDIIKAVSLSAVLLPFIAFLNQTSHYISRPSFLIYWFLSVVFICTSRFVFDFSTKFVRKKGAIRHSIFVITDTDEKEYHINLLEQDHCYNIQGVAQSSCLDLANRKATFEYLQKQGVVEAFVSWSSIRNRLYICWHFYTAGITLRILPTVDDFRHPKSIPSMVGAAPCPIIPAPIIIGGDFWVKRFFDTVASIILILLFSPLYLLIGLVIKLDSPGPVFFKQKRVGLHGNEFYIWKFRTMVVNAEILQASLESQNKIKDGVLFKLENDPRITRVGKLLRRYSLDELPQLFNVVLGEMSLVGPRPLPLRDVEKFQKSHFIRQEVLPGITGLWQVSGRSDIESFEDAVKLDVDYIQHWSIWMDFKILLKTFNVVLQKTGAY